jgi:Family of unknown function (DUF6510)
MSYVDGNALSAALSLAFGADIAAGDGICSHCGYHHPFAEAHVYLRNPGMVMRCPNCQGAELTLVEIEHHLHITIHGLATINLPSPSAN